MRLATETISDSELHHLDGLVESALATGDESELPVLGFGEISMVLGWPADEPRFACKRLPPFPSHERFDSYRDSLEDYLGALDTAGIRVVETDMRPVEQEDGAVAAYVVQPVLPAEQLAPDVLRRSQAAEGHPLVPAVVRAVADTVSPGVGLDAQLANWTWDGERLTYIDVSTPLTWSAEGRARLDLDVLAEAYPGILRWPLKRFVAPGILDTYRDLRKVYLDLTGNLIKERLDPWLPRFLEQINGQIEEPLSEAEVRRYYRSDARLWAALLRMRRLDRAWRRHVRRRSYPFLLPGSIER